MKKLSIILLLLLSASVLFAGPAAEGTTKIGISKFVAHPALDAVEQGIQDALAEAGHTDVEYDLQNANADMNSVASISSKFKADKVDVAIGIATPSAISLVQAISDIPVVFTAVTDPVDSGLVGSLGASGTNVTGYSDMTPVREQIELMVNLGGVKRVGHVFSSGEANAVVLAKMAEEACKALGVTFVPATVTNSSEVRTAALSIINKVDAIYLSTDNTVVSAISALAAVASDRGVPIISADPSSAEDFEILAAYGFDYYTMGTATGRLVAQILDGKDPGTIATQFLTDSSDLVLLLNLDVAKKLGITLSDAAKKEADKIFENGVLRDN
ncbi:MAG: ABC transporter substrate-binding protein [Spirochaetales bacterium]|jgi:putative tryptophan/tyrosine transport system substrate-binding protein|nr:ABC transporter substrate-binding protein [Spirochaetales bacterium]